MLPTPQSQEQYINVHHGSVLPLDRLMQAQMIAAGLDENCKSIQAINSLICYGFNLSFCKASSCYYRTGLIGTYLSLLLQARTSAKTKKNLYYNSQEDTLPTSPVFQSRLTEILKSQGPGYLRSLTSIESELAEFLQHSSEACYYLNDITGQYLNLLSMQEGSICLNVAVDAEKAKKFLVDELLPSLNKYEHLFLHSQLFEFLKQINLIDDYHCSESGKNTPEVEDHLIFVTNAAPTDLKEVLSYSRSRPVPKVQYKWVTDMINRDALRSNSEVVVLDVTSTSFQRGVTNFTADNLFECMQRIGYPDGGISLTFTPGILARLEEACLVDCYNGRKKFQGADVTVSTAKSKNLPAGVFETKVFAGDKHRATLRTREY